jgi:hypothetical protein
VEDAAREVEALKEEMYELEESRYATKEG